MDISIVHISTSISLVALISATFYFAYWKGKIDTRMNNVESNMSEHMRSHVDENNRSDGKFDELTRLLREIRESVVRLEANEESHLSRIDALERRNERDA